jgi:transposase
LREVFNGLRYVVKNGIPWRAMPHDLPPWAAVYQQAQRWLQAGCLEMLAHDLLALHVTPASANDRAAVAELAEAVQDVTGASVELAFVDQGYTGERPADAAQAHGIALEVVGLPEAKRGFVWLPRRWVVERSFAWMARCRRLARDYERLPEVLAGLHLVAFVILMLRRAANLALVHNSR